MRRTLIAFILCWLTVYIHAFTLLPPDGAATKAVYNYGDTLLFFDGNPELKTSDGRNVDWYLTTDTLNPLQTNSAEILSLSSGDGVAVRDAGRWIVRYVYNYNVVAPVIDSMTVTYHCDNTIFEIPATGTNHASAVLYYDLDGMENSYSLVGTLKFNNLEWSTDKWDTIQTTKSIRLSALPYSLYADKIYTPSPSVSFEYDTVGAALLGSPRTPIVIYETNSPMAVTNHATSVTTIRTATNEVERPETSEAISGSAPLSILFKANPTPLADFYSWRIYKGNQLLASRVDENHRFEFVENGNYRVVSTVRNLICPCDEINNPNSGCKPDSTEILVTVSTSMLLVPNVFTPNGDGTNDEFRVLHRSLREFHCEIYNRWGKLVYRWDDPNRGWDGTINGRPAAEGAYFYVIRALGTDATEGYTSRAKYKKAKESGDAVGVYQLSGDINLLRGNK